MLLYSPYCREYHHYFIVLFHVNLYKPLIPLTTSGWHKSHVLDFSISPPKLSSLLCLNLRPCIPQFFRFERVYFSFFFT